MSPSGGDPRPVLARAIIARCGGGGKERKKKRKENRVRQGLPFSVSRRSSDDDARRDLKWKDSRLG